MTTAAGIEIKPPLHTRKVELRCGKTAVTWLCVQMVEGPARFPIMGVDEEGFFHSWRQGGFWRADCEPHPFDIVR